MDRRTYEGPMDWEYQDSGPFDPTSPFTHAAKSNSQNVFSSPSKPSLRPNPFANLGTPSRARPPQSSFFTPQVPPKAAAPPFRNPAFTTPRRPFEDLALSEASGAEDSPAQTEVSDFPNDTPEVDHTSDINMGGMASPSKIDKSYRYNKAPFSSKKHTPGRGEIRTSRDLSVSEFIRKRKRHNLDRDVSNITRHRWTESDSDSGDSIAPRRRSRGKKKTKETPKGFLGSLFHILDEHPNAPDNLYRWVKLLVNFFLVSVFVYIGWSIVSTIKTDIENANEMARIEIMARITECQTKYTINSCSNNDRPALQPSCDEWFECMTQNPEAIMRVKVTAKQIAEIINEFSDAMNLKAWGFFFAVLIFCAFANNFFLGGYVNKPAPPVQSQPAAPSREPSMVPESGPGFMWVPVQTPRMKRHMMLDEGTDTDNTPPKMKTLLPPPFTPSIRRSPSKGDRGRSPVKNRSPSKGRREPFA
ncbi:Di-sulfide bridge nucleocytoplasmic transport domain-containing protein [Fusarium flagelliforme]|uniref:Di-sulfide bridge nucleocytoplasmic transport domain-containing protein n=1 Tax=Fusarium flagelliforme TaxID=2675880 RepID=UPI001E8CA0EC|nr:Di-sulfide bridge nucleocytoplasmic transport domain-containing protein [Fusarium flagelliforme]KAH7185234.1 Di-sulfide bridge nucleocytoplasmic transport domain-containing protein [Fusarium flagelliforme]